MRARYRGACLSMSGGQDFGTLPVRKLVVVLMWRICVSMRSCLSKCLIIITLKVHTTKISPTSFDAVHFSVYPSFLYVGFEPASSGCGSMRSSINTSRIKLLITLAPTGTYVRDHRTTPEVVNISKVSNMAYVGMCIWSERREEW
jgi:hypothetical protein